MRKYSLNEDFFEKIDTEEKAYWLGFISADGCIGKNRHGNYIYLSLALARKDRSHIEKWARAIGYDGPVHDYASYPKNAPVNEYSKLVISSRKMTDDLRKLGVTEKKSLVIRPAVVLEKLRPAYLRGIMDGDGSVYLDKDGSAGVRFNGSESVVEMFEQFARSVTGTKAKKFPAKSIFTFVLHGNKMVGRLLEVLYGDARVALARKNEVAQAILGKYRCVEEVA